MNTITVSIVVAIYNVEKFLPKCIESIITQDYTNIEIILINDKSTDKCEEICKTYLNKDSRIKFINNIENMRQSRVRNLGLENSTGDYIVFVDGDDWLATNFISYMLNIIISTKTDYAINLVNYTTRNMKQVKSDYITTWTAEKATYMLLYPKISIGCWNKIYNRNFLIKNGIKFDSTLFTAEGYRFISDLSQITDNIGVGNKKVYYYRLNNSNSATKKYDIKQSINSIKVAENIKIDLKIRTASTLHAINHHILINHIWNVRQIIALKLTKSCKNDYKASLKYIKDNSFIIIKNEKSIFIKIKYFIIFLLPRSTSIIRNIIFDFKLNNDIKKGRKNEK